MNRNSTPQGRTISCKELTAVCIPALSALVSLLCILSKAKAQIAHLLISNSNIYTPGSNPGYYKIVSVHANASVYNKIINGYVKHNTEE